ncbi:nitrite reductase large subunit NirB [Alkalihalobacterium bogoriense]|uniref:nitrite reductase large subunit NirB n=1 Tax=Alkalihalobacterium bogoriense TaxID=246272 RepID=UPI00047C5781|nr:nitrite reductase large subunit NirB [Alkalihalobacterium bogoriense]
MAKQKLVLIGNGMAGVRAIEEIIKVGGKDKFEITIFGSEPHVNYNRIALSTVLQGDTTIKDIELNSLEWYEENNITLYTSETVMKLDKEKKTIVTDKGREVSYDYAIIATGSHPFMLPLPGADLEGVIAFRNIKDCEMMIEAAENYKKAVVIGGGLLGLEAARGLINLGMKVDVVHIQDYLMERQLDQDAGRLLRIELEKQGMNFLMPKLTSEIVGRKRVKKIRFKDGTETTADLVVMAVGIKPNVDVAKASDIEVNRGIVVNDFMETSADGVFAVGECAEHREIVYGLVAPLWEQGKVLAKRICGEDAGVGYEGSVLSTKLKVSGVNVFSAGEFMDDGSTRSVRVYDEFEGIYKKVMIRDNKVVGAVLFGDTKEGPKLFNMIQDGADVSDMAPISILQDGSTSGESIVASMADSDTVCGCNGVSKGEIVNSIKVDGMCSVEEVSGCTNAGRSCGTCKPMIAELLELTLGDEFDGANQKQTLCSCTTLTHEEVVDEIRAKGLTHSKEVMNVLGWKTDEGCSKCRPAINYYLGMVHPTIHEDERESRFVNERMHANIQKDGTYSVVPRMYGGVTNSSELRRIADVADKYDVPLMKITGGQRIDLFGVKKEDLPQVWKELDMPSGYAYGKSLRTVKTCVGENFCRFGTQDSIGMGIALEKKFERLPTPHKVKMAVSACPRNCAESGIKDLGIVGVEGAWEIYVGGNGGTELRKADLLCKVKTSEEVLEITAAYLQLYRETARYLERTAPWVERYGLELIRKEIIEDEENRKALSDRMDTALSVLHDPWEEIIGSEDLKQTLFSNNKVKVVQS